MNHRTHMGLKAMKKQKKDKKKINHQTRMTTGTAGAAIGTPQESAGGWKGTSTKTWKRRVRMMSHQSWTERLRVQQTNQMIRQGDPTGPSDVIAAVLKAATMAEGPASVWCRAAMPETTLDIE